jgi:SsrA-binding protein
MSGRPGSQNARYQSAYSWTGANAGTVAMFMWTNMPYRRCVNHSGTVCAEIVTLRNARSAAKWRQYPCVPMSRRGDNLLITNRKARHNYFILESWEAGLVLEGSEVKSLREGHANLQDSYARIEDGEAWLYGMHVLPYAFSRGEIDPVRRRKLLLHQKEISELWHKTQEKGLTIVPLRVYFKDGRAKVEIGLAKGKRNYDKRQVLAERDAKRETERAMKGRGD